ncbi:DUF883 family protein [Mesorhizobium sp.]|uniref:DUF883 family protein n=1 Tax=Mesorhizobium sp. TaxID=1871066 RepID=UPI000FE3BC6E|nr:DUF883 family protein [Mesorhizobium sp.]RWH70480.1 MAG: DUF883 family protein [Mesorhizobium sp.]RWL24036.1 MAG: DUF883 family protein [Mesorhizobium sp.]RWL30244.1 MAG: DUF883 family protein [Mesorhizobium sp.]RWL33621.1 MAG: DUF883 family protein [Mesorhizobium sp.]RWL47752.1 MAG: DUF883 family protein [Mesorhizobium sp.]
MASFSSLSDLDIEKQVATLTRQLNDLKKVLARRGDAYYEDGREAASDYYSQLYDRLHEALPAIRRRGKVIERTARDHPATTAAVGLLVVGLLAGLLISRR